MGNASPFVRVRYANVANCWLTVWPTEASARQGVLIVRSIFWLLAITVQLAAVQLLSAMGLSLLDNVSRTVHNAGGQLD